MSRRTAGAEERLSLAVLGAPGAGKAELLRFISLRQEVAEPVIWKLGELAYCRVEWRETDAAGAPVHVTLRCVHGEPVYRAAEDLLVRDADGVIFVFDVRESHLERSWLALAAAAESARRSGFELMDLPLVIQYHRADMQPGFEVEKMDRWLGLSAADAAARVATPGEVPDGDGEVLAALWSRFRRTAE